MNPLHASERLLIPSSLDQGSQTPKPLEEKPHVPKDRVEIPAKEEVDRPTRIRIALSKATLHISDWIRIGTAGYIGEVVGIAIASSLIGGPAACAIGGAIGAVGAILLDHYKVPSKIKKAIGSAIGRAAHEVKETGQAVKKAFQQALGLKEKEASGKRGEIPGAPKSISITTEGEPPAGGEKKRSILSVLASGIGAGAKVLKSFPKFLYPSIKNTTAAEKKLILETLDSLPLKDVTSVGQITMNPKLAESMGAAGLAGSEIFREVIEFDRQELSFPGWNKHVIIHELGHTRDAAEGILPSIVRKSGTAFGPFGFGPWGKGPFVSDYAATKHLEDFAESHSWFHLNPESLKEVNPAKYEAMKKLHEPSLYDKIVDRPAVRETGKKVSEAIDRVPGLRTALQVGGAILGPLEMHKGATEIKQGILEQDARKKIDGQLDLAQGIAFSSRVAAPAGLALAGLRFYLHRALNKGKMTVEKAQRIAGTALAASAGPIGLTIYAAIQEMLKPDSTQGQPGIGDGLKFKETPSRLIEPKKVVRGEYKVDSSTLKNEDVALTRKDKIFMAKVGGGAALGGIAGTLLGAEGGGLVGAAVGGLVGGPFGALLGSYIGKAVGAMSLSYKGAKLGGRLGRMLDHS